MKSSLAQSDLHFSLNLLCLYGIPYRSFAWFMQKFIIVWWEDTEVSTFYPKKSGMSTIETTETLYNETNASTLKNSANNMKKAETQLSKIKWMFSGKKVVFLLLSKQMRTNLGIVCSVNNYDACLIRPNTSICLRKRRKYCRIERLQN